MYVNFIEFARWGLEIYKPQEKKNILFWSTSRLVCTSVRPSVRPSTDHSLSPMQLIFGMEGFSPSCQRNFFLFFEILIFDLLMAILSFFFQFFLLYSLLNMKAPVDRTKQLRDLKFGIQGLCRIANVYLSPFLKILKTTSGFVEKSKLAAKQALQATVFDLGG